ncbi:hypothetical protein [Pseudooceanicola sp.]|uniref:hypothetical protein n=1 Tax=Pseudooceanicola sp. TaxID=1914328 RepID=UPI004057E275|tara:strand:- start:19217 stop:19453 length:237 start_codon:yes stop_codon:yes gene_type:complete
MSAPTTNVDRQAKRHRGPIWGILIALAFGGVMGAAITLTATGGDNPDGANTQIDGRTGDTTIGETADTPATQAPATTN